MQEKLVIYLHADDLVHPSWAVLDANKHVRQSAVRDSMEGLASLADDRDIIVIVPAQDVLLIRIVLPVMKRTRLVQAVPFALEEQLIDEPSDLHFAIGVQEADGTLPVVIVSHEKMRQWVALLQAVQREATVFIPAFLALPFDDTVWHGLFTDMMMVRTGACQGFACDPSNTAYFLNHALTSAQSRPGRLVIENATHDALPALTSLEIKSEEHRLSFQQIIVNFAEALPDSLPMNMLQTPYAVKKSVFPRQDKLWKMTSYLATAMVALLFLYPTVSYFMLNHRLETIDGQIQQIYKRHFPQATHNAVPPLQLEEKLKKLMNQYGDQRFLGLLGDVGQGLQDAKAVQLKRFDFQSNQLTLQLTAASSNDFSIFIDVLTRAGLHVKQQNVDLLNTPMRATLLIE